MNLLTMLIPSFWGNEKVSYPVSSRGGKILPDGLVVEVSPRAWWSVGANRTITTQLTALEGSITGLETYAGKVRAVWLEHHIICVDGASQGVSSLRLNRPVQLLVLQKGSGWVLREAIALPTQPTLVELEPLETPALIGFATESMPCDTYFHEKLR